MDTLQIAESTYARLTLAANDRSVSVDELLTFALNEINTGAGANRRKLSIEERLRRLAILDQHIASRGPLYEPGHVVDVSRECIYEGCGE